MTILTLMQCLTPILTNTTLRQCSQIITAMLAMTGRVTMLGLSRWTDGGGSYRTIQRWFQTVMPWVQVLVYFFRQHLFHPEEVYILAGDEVVTTKAGKHTFGLDRFFSSLQQRIVPGVCGFALSVVGTTERVAFPLYVEQVIRSEAEKAAQKLKAAQRPRKGTPGQGKPGRPQGSRNKPKADMTLTPELQRIQSMLQRLLSLLAGWLPLTYLALDGHFGNHNALAMVRQCHLHLISKLRYDAALFFPYAGAPPPRGPRRKYGAKVQYHHLPKACLQQITVEDGLETRVYQAALLHREFNQPLNVVILVKTHLRTQAWAHVILFSSDLALSWQCLLDYYHLRFQIEFNFRDAKQFWGLEDFMNIKATPVTNAINLSFFMILVTAALRRSFRLAPADFSVLDLKTYYRGHKYLTEIIQLLPEKPDEFLLTRLFRRIGELGSIHPLPASFP